MLLFKYQVGEDSVSTLYDNFYMNSSICQPFIAKICTTSLLENCIFIEEETLNCQGTFDFRITKPFNFKSGFNQIRVVLEVKKIS